MSYVGVFPLRYRDRLPERIAKGVQKLDQAAKSSDVSGECWACVVCSPLRL